MRQLVRAVFAVLPSCLIAASVAIGQGRTIQGVVIDSSGAAIAYANVTLEAGRRIVAGADGRFRLNVDTAVVRRVEIRRIGYHPLSVALDAWPDTGLRIVLTAAARWLSVVNVEASRIQSLAFRGFYERMAEVEKGIGHGYFITPEDMAARPSAKVTHFMGSIPAIRVHRIKEATRNGQYGMQIQGLDGCRMTVYVDGIRFYSFDPERLIMPGEGFIDDLVSTNTIAGIEVYPRAVGAPPKYQSLNGTCGVVLIWSR